MLIPELCALLVRRDRYWISTARSTEHGVEIISCQTAIAIMHDVITAPNFLALEFDHLRVACELSSRLGYHSIITVMLVKYVMSRGSSILVGIELTHARQSSRRRA